MTRTITDIASIYALQWDVLAQSVRTASWFQTREAVAFYAQLPEELRAVVCAVEENGVLIEFDGHIVSGTACVCLPGRTVYEWYVCGDDEHFAQVYPSSYATYQGILYAAENGFTRFDMMGASAPDEESGVRDFKARFGGQLVEYGRFRCVCNPIRYKLGSLGVKLLKRL